jgi:universal stress protein E
VKKLSTILVVLDGFDGSQHVLVKSLILARHLNARVELFLCDSEPAYVLQHTYDQEIVEHARQACLQNARSYLDSLLRSVLAADVAISTDVACESPQYESVVHKVLTSTPDFVIKGVGRSRAARWSSLDANEWELARACPVPLLLTRGRPWHAQPHFAAAVDMFEDEASGSARTIMRTADFMARGCNAVLHAIYSECATGDASGHTSRVRMLRKLGTEFGIATNGLHMLSGEPERSLSKFVTEQRYDMLVLGALAHSLAYTSVVGTLTSKLVEALDCDLLLVRSGDCVASE